MKRLTLLTLCLSPLLACDGATPVAERQSALRVGTADVVLKVRSAAQKVAEATRELNDLVAGAYVHWPSKVEFERAASFREFRSDLEALNAAALTAGAYTAGAYSNPILEIEDEQFVAGAYVHGLAAGAYTLGVVDKVIRLNRE